MSEYVYRYLNGQPTSPVYHLPLGRGDLRAAGVGQKAASLELARRRGLPVPRGWVVLDKAYHAAFAEGLLRYEDGKIKTPDPLSLLYLLRLPAMPPLLAVRSAFSAEDQSGESLSGVFTSVLNVDSGNPYQFAGALCAVWSSSLRYPHDFRRDILLMPMIPAQYAGVAIIGRAADTIRFTEGIAAHLITGSDPGQQISLPHWRPFAATPATTLPAEVAGRLARLLWGCRRWFRPPLQIEWADDGRRCWLLQVRGQNGQKSR